MEITLNDYQTSHPEGKIRLLDGRIIQGYTPQRIATSKQGLVAQEKQDSKWRLWPFSTKKRTKNTAREEGRFFYEHAHFFLEHADAILADSRMFLAPVPVGNNLAFVGTNKINHSTLGAYIEWWLHISASAVVEKNHHWLVWYIAGSPLSGSNRCSLVNEEGKIQTRCLRPFSDVWTSFARINERYSPIQNDFGTFSLEDVYALLSCDKNNFGFKECIFDNLRLRCANIVSQKKLKEKDAQIKHLKDELNHTRMLLHETALQEIYDKWCFLVSDGKKRKEELIEARKIWLDRLRSGEISDYEYQQAMDPIRKEMKKIHRMDCPELTQQVEAKGLSLYEVIDYFKKKDNQGEWI